MKSASSRTASSDSFAALYAPGWNSGVCAARLSKVCRRERERSEDSPRRVFVPKSTRKKGKLWDGGRSGRQVVEVGGGTYLHLALRFLF